jgi:hypothetical protein
MTPPLDASPPAYVPRDPSTTVLYRVVADHLETFLASLDADKADDAPDAGSPRWRWAQLLTRVLARDMARCPCCQQGTLRIIAAITQGVVIQTILRI